MAYPLNTARRFGNAIEDQSDRIVFLRALDAASKDQVGDVQTISSDAIRDALDDPLLDPLLERLASEWVLHLENIEDTHGDNVRGHMN